MHIEGGKTDCDEGLSSLHTSRRTFHVKCAFLPFSHIEHTCSLYHVAQYGGRMNASESSSHNVILAARLLAFGLNCKRKFALQTSRKLVALCLDPVDFASPLVSSSRLSPRGTILSCLMLCSFSRSIC